MANKYTVELDLLEISRITDALELWKEQIVITFHPEFQAEEHENITYIVTKLVNSIPPVEYDPNCKICGIPGGH